MMTRLFILLFAAFQCFNALGQQFDYQLQIKNIRQPETVLFGYWYSGQAFLLDSVQVDSTHSLAQFRGEKKLDAGQYFFAHNQTKQTLDFILNEEPKLQFYTDWNAWVDSFGVVASKENKPYLAWQKTRREMEANIATQRNMMEMLQRATRDREVLNEQALRLREMRLQVDSIARGQIQKYPKLLFAKMVNAEIPPEIPPTISPLQQNGQANPAYMQYFRRHFWDNYDFQDERLLYSPVPARLTDTWLQVQQSQLDSVQADLKYFLKKAKVNTTTYHQYLQLLLERFDIPSFGGNETMLVHLFDFYMPTATESGIDTAAWMRVEYKVNAYRPTLPGLQAPDFSLEDTSGNLIKLSDFKARYTLLYFFSPLCSHCKKTTPDVYALTMPLAEKGIRVLAVTTDGQKENWKSYVKQVVPEWTCVADFTEPSEIEKKYATSALPNIMLLDENKNILIRRLSAEELPRILQMISQ